MFNLAFWKWFAKEGDVPTIACFPLIEVYPVFSVSGERKTLLRSYFIDGHQKRLIAPHCVSKMYPNGPQLQLSFGPFTRITVVPTIIKAFIKQDTDADVAVLLKFRMDKQLNIILCGLCLDSFFGLALKCNSRGHCFVFFCFLLLLAGLSVLDTRHLSWLLWTSRGRREQEERGI